MKPVISTTFQRRLAVLAMLLLTFGLIGTEDAQAQYEFRWLSVGDFQHRYNGGLGQPEIYDPFPLMVWPGIYNIAPGGVSYMHVLGYWISARNVVDEQGNEYPVRTSHSGPRALGIGEFFQTEMALISQFPEPQVTVDRQNTFQVPVVIDDTDPNLPADRMVLNRVNTSIGVSVEQRSIQFSNQFHDDYHITEFRFTNTGNVDGDEEVELPDQSLDDVYFSFIRRPKTSASSTSWGNSMGAAAWGAINQTDIVGNGEHDYGLPEDWRGMFTWLEHGPDVSEYSTIGGPMWVPGAWWYAVQTDTTGRLGAAAMHGEFILHADGEAHSPDPEGLGGHTLEDDLAQPRLMTYMNSDDADLTGNSNHNNIPLMLEEREWIENGVETRSTGMPQGWQTDLPDRTVPAQPYLAFPLADGQQDVDFVEHFSTTNAPTFGGSWSYGNNFGPYDMEPGEEVRIVVVDGVAGLSDSLAIQLGQWYRRQIEWQGMTRDEAGALQFHWNPQTNQTCEEGSAGCVSLTKDEWVMTTRDSLFQLVERATAAFESGYNVPSPPRPPSSFTVTSGTDEILVSWTPTDVPEGGWEIYRAQNRYQGFPAPGEEETYRLIAKLPPDRTSYADTEALPNIDYFYFLQAVGGPNSVDPLGINGTPGGAPLKSSRYYAQTYDPATLQIPPGDQAQSPEEQLRLNEMFPDTYACSAEPNTVCNYRCPASGLTPSGSSCTPGMIVSREVVEGLDGVRIVPNPYSIGASQDLRWPGESGQNRIAFWNLPGEATIRIYTEIGQLVKTIEHSGGSGVENWNLTTDSNQRIVSGIYLVVIRDEETSEQIVKKLVVIR